MAREISSMTAMPRPSDLAAAPTRRAERRLIGRALSYWDAVSGSCALPRYEDLAGGWGPIEESNLYLVEVGEDETHDFVVRAGATVIEALGRDPVGRRAIDVLPSSTERGLSFCRAVVAMKKPIADVGRFTNVRGEDIHYRSILLPLTDDDDRVAYVLGVFSHKRVH